MRDVDERSIDHIILLYYNRENRMIIVLFKFVRLNYLEILGYLIDTAYIYKKREK